MRLFISVVSHGHSSIIEKLATLSKLARLQSVKIILRDNVGEDSLRNYCKYHNIFYVKNDETIGFAKNNNLNFSLILEKYNVNKNDFFLILNPDIYISKENFNKFSLFLNNTQLNLISILQFSDMANQKIEPSARYFKYPIGLIIERFFKGRKLLVANTGLISSFDWVSGAFMAVRVSVYKEMNGLCEEYFMYYEDADFCLRCKLAGYNVHINTDISAVHLAQYSNRKLFSKAFFQSLISYTLFVAKLFKAKF